MEPVGLLTSSQEPNAILSQINPIHNITTYYVKIDLNIILP
jgi:hypothetical protein